jgi:hypothetical protein
MTSAVTNTSSKRVKRAKPGNALVSPEQRAHAERLGQSCYPLPDCGFAEYAEHRTRQIANRMREEAELVCLLSLARDDVSPVYPASESRKARISANVCSGTVLTT